MASSEADGSTNVITSSSKKQKITVTGAEETLVDRISELPESLLVQILSLLPTKDAFRTCILSKRWSYLCTFVYNLELRCISVDNAENFVSFVDYVLAHSVSSKFQKFELSYDYPLSQISRWLCFAAEKNVEHVFIWSIHENPTCTLPQSFRTCSSLTTLGLVNFPFDYDGVIQWKSLKTLNLTSLLISNDDMVNLLSGCPALETMQLAYFRGFSRLEINSLKLKTLKLGDYCWANDGSDHSLEIIAPNLQHLEIAGDLYDLKCRLVDVSSVVNAKLTFDITCIKDIWGDHGEEFDDDNDDEDSCHDYHHVFKPLVQDYSQKLSNASKLTIGTWFIKVLCMLQSKVVPIPELKCRHLKLQMHVDQINLFGVSGLLRASSHVETLNIDIEHVLPDKSLCHSESRYLEKGDDNIDLQSWISSLVFPNLKKVEIVISLEVFSLGLNGVLCLKEHPNWGFNKLFELSEFLLKAATNLEKFVIISKRTKCETCKTCSMNCVYLYLSRLTEKLLGCPRSSANSVIIFQELSLRDKKCCHW